MSAEFLQVDALITGQIRDIKVFTAAMGYFIRLRDQGVFRNVILSTWSIDAKNHEAVLSGLVASGIKLIISNGPLPVRSCGNYWEQVKLIAAGMEGIEDGVLVFKSRTDILYYGGENTIANIINNNKARPAAAYGIKHRIWIPSFVPSQPFFMADQCFLCLAEDLLKFLRFDADVEAQGTPIAFYPGSTTHPAAASAEIRFWIQPFLHEFPVLAEYSKIWPQYMNGHPQCPSMQSFLMASSLFKEYLILYWLILYKCFSVSEGNFCIAHTIDEAGKVIVRANSHAHNPSDFLSFEPLSPYSYPLSYSNDAGLKAFFDSQQGFQADYYNAMQRALNYVRTSKRIADFAAFTEEFRTIANSH